MDMLKWTWKMDQVIFVFGSMIAFACSESQEVCDRQTFHTSCPSSEILIIDQAKFGRMKIGECVKNDYGHIGCNADILHWTDSQCSGLRSCSIPVNAGINDLLVVPPCAYGLLTYMEVDYTCIQVEARTNNACRTPTGGAIATSRGALSSHVTDTTGCGSMNTPWVINMSPGQRVNISMTDFGWKPSNGNIRSSNLCNTYGYITEKGLGVNKSLCGGMSRYRHVFLSASSHVEIQILPLRQRNMESQFLLMFEVIGCPDITPPTHAWYKRNGSMAVIGCEWSEHSWHLVCEGNHWNGVVGNCSDGGTKPSPPSTEDLPLTQELSLIIIIGLGVLVVALLCAICIGYACYRKSRRTREPPQFAPSVEQQQFLYHPGRPVPLQNPAGLNMGTLIQTAPRKTTDVTHIWETPLPAPGGNKSHDDSGLGDTSLPFSEQPMVEHTGQATLPVRGTAHAPVALDDGSQWNGTQNFYDPLNHGWMTIPKDM